MKAKKGKPGFVQMENSEKRDKGVQGRRGPVNKGEAAAGEAADTAG